MNISFKKDDVDLMKKLLFITSQNLQDYSPNRLDNEGIVALVNQTRELLAKGE